MPSERAERKLAAILAADVAGYSRLTGADEEGTLAALKARRTEILQPAVAKHHGRIVKVMGDGVLVEFGSAVNAVVARAPTRGHSAGRELSRPTRASKFSAISMQASDKESDAGECVATTYSQSQNNSAILNFP